MILVALLFSHFSCSSFPVEFMMHFDLNNFLIHFLRKKMFVDVRPFFITVNDSEGILIFAIAWSRISASTSNTVSEWDDFFRLFCLLTCFRVLYLTGRSSIIYDKWITITITLKASCVPRGSDSYKTPIANRKQVRTRTGEWLVRRRGMSPDDSPS